MWFIVVRCGSVWFRVGQCDSMSLSFSTDQYVSVWSLFHQSSNITVSAMFTHTKSSTDAIYESAFPAGADHRTYVP